MGFNLVWSFSRYRRMEGKGIDNGCKGAFVIMIYEI